MDNIITWYPGKFLIKGKTCIFNTIANFGLTNNVKKVEVEFKAV